ncbi:transporter substrate-binding domain-containing protein [Marinobacteraceae bacterium S3BR75-40.1]
MIWIMTVTPAFAEKPRLRVGLEPFPPLITEAKGGYSIDWLRAMAREAGMTLDIRIMPYSRAKLALKSGRVDLMGHTPYGFETGQFYDFAVELEHRVPTKMDAFSLSPDKITSAALHRQVIATPFGNADFIAELTGVPRDQFVEGTLERTVRMMRLKHVDTVIFERASVVSHLPKSNRDRIYYRLVQAIDAGFAVRKDRPELLKRLNEAGRKVDARAIYAPYMRILDWPDAGRVPAPD